jgi:hypothetical protein
MPKAKNLADFKNVADPDVIVPRKMREALAAMAKEGPENWEYEGDFIKRACVSNFHCARYREQFIEHVIEIRENGKASRRVWFGSAKVAAKARGE